MKPKAPAQFWFFSLSLIGLRIADVAITYVVSPDLRWEINPLVSVAGLGWLTLISYNIFGAALAIVLFYYSLSGSDGMYPPERGYTQKEFVSHYLFGDRNSFSQIYYRVPRNKKAIYHYCGYVFIRVLILWSLVIVLHNALVWQSGAFRAFMSSQKLWLTVYGLLILLVPIYSLQFFRSLYTQYNSFET